MFWQAIVNGLLIGGLYALVGMGLAIIFGTMNLINFAHGEFMMIGMYVTYSLFKAFHLDPYLSLPLSFLVTFILGYIFFKTIVFRVVSASHMNQILLTAGVGMMLTNLSQMLFTSQQYTLDLSYSNSVLKLFGIQLNIAYLISFSLALVITFLLFWFIMKTETGRSLRAVSQNRSSAFLMGINVNKISALVFALGISLAGVAGTLLLPVYRVSPTVGETFTLTAFVVVILGGMGSIAGATIGGLIIGVVQSYSESFLGGGYGELITFIVFLLILLLKPTGLMGRSRL